MRDAAALVLSSVANNLSCNLVEHDVADACSELELDVKRTEIREAERKLSLIARIRFGGQEKKSGTEKRATRIDHRHKIKWRPDGFGCLYEIVFARSDDELILYISFLETINLFRLHATSLPEAGGAVSFNVGAPADNLMNDAKTEVDTCSFGVREIAPAKFRNEVFVFNSFYNFVNANNRHGSSILHAKRCKDIDMTPENTLGLIAAVSAADRGIGKGGQLLWQIPDDMKRFKELTTGHPVVMGRKTWESLPSKFRPLPGRTNIVITRSSGYEAPGALVVDSIYSARAAAARAPGASEIFVIGGGEIYAAALPFAKRLYLTLVDADADADTFFPPYESEFVVIKSETGVGEPPHRFVVLEKK